MAYSFVEASAEDLDYGDVTFADGLSEISIHAWVKIDNTGDADSIFGKFDASASGWGLDKTSTDDVYRSIFRFTAPGLSSILNGATAASTGVWQSVGTSFKRNTLGGQILYLDGAVDASRDAPDRSLQNHDTILYVGRQNNSNFPSFADADIAECAIWNVALSAEDFAALANGAPANYIKPGNLLFYAPLTSFQKDIIQEISPTVHGTPDLVEHPPVNHGGVFVHTVTVTAVPVNTDIGSRVFDGQTNNKLRFSGNPVGTGIEPCTITAWVNPDTTGSLMAIAGFIETANPEHWTYIYLDNDATAVATKQDTSGNFSGAIARSVNTYTSGNWHHMAGKFIADDSREIILNGDTTNKGTSAISRTDGVASRFSVNTFDDDTPNFPYSGKAAHVALWDVALTDDEIVALSQGANPLWIRRNSLVSYWPILGVHDPEIDIVGTNDFTVLGTLEPSSDSPPIANVIGRYSIISGVAAPVANLGLGIIIGL